MSKENPKVLILSMTVGQGHNATSKALSEYLQPLGTQCTILDTYKYLNSFVGNGFDKGYTYLVKHTPGIYNKIFNIGEKVQYKQNPNLKIIFPFLFADIVKKKMSKYIAMEEPDVIVCPHVFCAIIINQLRVSGLIDPKIKFVGINTDYQIHPFWEFTNPDYFVVAADFLIKEASRRGIDPSIVKPFGIPVNERFNNITDTKTARNLLGLKDKFTIMVASGGMGFVDMEPVMRNLDEADDIQIIAICGSNKKMYNQLSRKKYKNDVVVLGFTDKMSDYMDAADIIYTKPGGLSTSETLAKGKPMFLMRPLPGVEEANMAFMVNCSLAMFTNQYITGNTMINIIKNNPEILEDMRKARDKFAKRHSAKNTGDFILGIIREEN